MSWEAQKHLYQVAFSCLDKFFQYKISGDFEREKKKNLQRIFTFTVLYPVRISDQLFRFLFCFVLFFNQASTVIAQVGKQAVDEFWIVCRGF